MRYDGLLRVHGNHAHDNINVMYMCAFQELNPPLKPLGILFFNPPPLGDLGTMFFSGATRSTPNQSYQTRHAGRALRKRCDEQQVCCD